MKTHIPDIQHCNISGKDPYIIYDVTNSDYSLATIHKRVRIGKSIYHYMPDTNELIRRDVIVWQAKRNNRVF